MKRLTEHDKRALSDAVKAVEAECSAEIVVAVRPESMPPHQAYALAPSAFALLGLFFLVESPWPFSNLALWLDTALFALLGYAFCRGLPGFGRLFILRSSADRAVTQAAYRELFLRGVLETRERTGMLVYVSQREGSAKVLFDRGITDRVDSRELAKAAAQIERVAQSPRSDGIAVAKAIEAIAPLFAAHLPRRDDDVNELEDGVFSP